MSTEQWFKHSLSCSTLYGPAPISHLRPVRCDGIVGPWQQTSFTAGDNPWELEFATVYIGVCMISNPPQVEVSGVGTFNIGEIMHVPPGANISFCIHETDCSVSSNWLSTQFNAGYTAWDLEGAVDWSECVVCVDADSDGICDSDDNCLDTPNPDQTDGDGDGIGDVCDPCPVDNPDDTDGDGVCNSDDICPSGDDSVDNDGDGVPDACDPCPNDNPDDLDGDGICYSNDVCPDTAIDGIVNDEGCSIEDLCPCENQPPWRNHGKYVSCTAKTAESFVDEGLITQEEKDMVVSEAAKSDCGM